MRKATHNVPTQPPTKLTAHRQDRQALIILAGCYDAAQERALEAQRLGLRAAQSGGRSWNCTAGPICSGNGFAVLAVGASARWLCSRACWRLWRR